MLDPVTANFLGDNLRCWMQVQVKVTDDGIKLPWRTKTRASHDILLILLTSLLSHDNVINQPGVTPMQPLIRL